jgi:AraC family transcriptional activator FtrA
MSERTFVRRFRATTGMAPGDWMRRQRMEHAKELLERSSLTIDQVAAQSGLGTAMTMRHHFRRRIGLSPVEYRRRFSQVAIR